jgi:hypothetical protein
MPERDSVRLDTPELTAVRGHEMETRERLAPKRARDRTAPTTRQTYTQMRRDFGCHARHKG